MVSRRPARPHSSFVFAVLLWEADMVGGPPFELGSVTPRACCKARSGRRTATQFLRRPGQPLAAGCGGCVGFLAATVSLLVWNRTVVLNSEHGFTIERLDDGGVRSLAWHGGQVSARTQWPT